MTFTQLRAFCSDNNITVTGDKRKKATYELAIAVWKKTKVTETVIDLTKAMLAQATVAVPTEPVNASIIYLLMFVPIALIAPIVFATVGLTVHATKKIGYKFTKLTTQS